MWTLFRLTSRKYFYFKSSSFLEYKHSSLYNVHKLHKWKAFLTSDISCFHTFFIIMKKMNMAYHMLAASCRLKNALMSHRDIFSKNVMENHPGLDLRLPVFMTDLSSWKPDLCWLNITNGALIFLYIVFIQYTKLYFPF